MSRLRLPLRLARREVRRRPGRTALVVLLVAIPIAAMTMAVTLIRSEGETPIEDWEQENGQADAVFGDPPPALPDRSRAVRVQQTFLRLRTTDGRRSDAEVTTLPLADPITSGIYDLVRGRAATAPDEAVLTRELADVLGADVGDTLHLESPNLALEVVGEAERTTCLSCRALLLRTDLDTLESTEGPFGASNLVELPQGVTVEEQVALEASSAGQGRFRDLAVMDHYQEVDGDQAVWWSLVLGAVVLLVVGIVISSAFAVGARRQLVMLGQLSASGAPPATIRAVLVLQGTVTGFVGAVVGVVLAGLVLVMFRSSLEVLLDQRLRGWDVRPTEVVAVVLLGMGTATCAALIPSRTAARIPTLSALAGRRPLAPVSRRLVTWGVAGVAGGLLLLFAAVLGSQGGRRDPWAYVAIAGGVLELLGACALAPAIVSRLEPLSARLRGSLRLGARTLARHRARTGAVVAAVAAAGALAVVAGAAVLGSERQDGVEPEVPDDVVVAVVSRFDDAGAPIVDAPLPDAMADELEGAVPGARLHELRTAAFPGNSPAYGGYWEEIDGPYHDGMYLHARSAYLADDAVLEAVRADEEVRSALDEHGVVMLASEAPGGDARMAAPDGREVAVRVVNHPYELGFDGRLLMTPEVASELDTTVAPIGAFLQLPRPLTDDDRAALEDVSFDLSDDLDASVTDDYAEVTWKTESSGPSPLQLELILSGVALVVCLFVVGVSLALAAAEGKDERDILTIAGAPPSTVARSAGARAWFMSVIGAVIAVPIGFLPVVVVSWASGHDPNTSGSFPIVFPTRTAFLLLVVVPLTVCAVAWMASAMAQRFRPVRISTATFE